jgi:ubiquinone/menaquinone biosynthesis C-methylase UbiE
MGANVTSVDISQNQINVACERAEQLGLQMSFVQADVTNLSELGDESFDLVYTGGHVAVWVSDLKKHYREASRILRRGGIFMIAEYHPFRRIWGASQNELCVEYPYFCRGPFEYDVEASVLRPRPGTLKSYEFHWTISDLINAVLNASCSIREVHEFGESVAEWEAAPMHGLPEFLLIIARKTSPE